MTKKLEKKNNAKPLLEEKNRWFQVCIGFTVVSGGVYRRVLFPRANVASAVQRIQGGTERELNGLSEIGGG